MATANISKPSKENIGSTTATVSFSCSVGNYPQNKTDYGTWTKLSETDSNRIYIKKDKITLYNHDTKYSWTFSPSGSSSEKSPTYTFLNLSPGTRVSISGKLTAYSTVTIITRTWVRKDTPIKDEEGKITGWNTGTPTYTDSSSSGENHYYAKGLSTDTISIYTKPNDFYWANIGTNVTIKVGLTKNEWDRFLKAADQYLHWKYQNGESDLENNYSVNSGTVITANIYNGPALALYISTVSGGSSGSVITASRFAALSAAIRG